MKMKKNKMSENKGIFKYFETHNYINILNDVNAFLATQYQAKFEDFFLANESGIPLNRSKNRFVDAMSPHIFN